LADMLGASLVIQLAAQLISNHQLAATCLPDSFGRHCSSSYWNRQWELKLLDVHSAKLLQPSGMVCRLHHALLRHTNDLDLRQRNIFMNWLLQTDHVHFHCSFFSDDLWSITKCI